MGPMVATSGITSPSAVARRAAVGSITALASTLA